MSHANESRREATGTAIGAVIVAGSAAGLLGVAGTAAAVLASVGSAAPLGGDDHGSK